MAYTIQSNEILKESGYWRAKGFKREGVADVLDRCDCMITYSRKKWHLFDKDRKTTKSFATLWGLLKNTI